MRSHLSHHNVMARHMFTLKLKIATAMQRSATGLRAVYNPTAPDLQSVGRDFDALSLRRSSHRPMEPA
jgi:hypothetical protein